VHYVIVLLPYQPFIACVAISIRHCW